jgi:hypothetical protein
MGSDELQVWLNHFEYHALEGRRMPADAPDTLRSDERNLIARSIAIFQLGGQVRGKSLVAAARRLAEARGMPALAKIMELLLAEELRHAAMLRAFMNDHAIPAKKPDWIDRALRRVRALGSLELEVHVLVCVELIGIVYYRALVPVTECQRLRNLCRVLVADELAHVGFESYFLLSLRERRSAPIRGVTRLAHRVFFGGAALAVWLRHRTVLRRAGYRAGSFLEVCFAQYDFYLEPPLTRSSRRESSKSCNLS